MSRTQRGPNDRHWMRSHEPPQRLPETDPNLPQVEIEPQAEAPEETNDPQPEIEETDSNV